MEGPRFNEIMEEQLERCRKMLGVKATEYATSDKLHNFKTAANLQGCTPEEALGGMMAKHTVSIYDMINSGKPYSEAVWNEKITDHMNYLILLQAIVAEERDSKAAKTPNTNPTNIVSL